MNRILHNTIYLILLYIFSLTANADIPITEDIKECGRIYSGPYGSSIDKYPRPCPKQGVRSYSSKFNGLGKKALDIESVGCFVPDKSYRLLDGIVENVKQLIPAPKTVPIGQELRLLVEDISETTGDVLADLGFGLKIGTRTLGGALFPRNKTGEAPRHITDCDTTSLILLEVADAYGLAADLVEITLSSGSGHNYVRWDLGKGSYLDWDTNGRAVCMTPDNLPAHEGRAMTENEVLSYLTVLRAGARDKAGLILQAVDDYREAIQLNPVSGIANNNLAWLIATQDIGRNQELRLLALQSAKVAVSVDRIPGYLDTLACAFALNSDFESAIGTQEEALELSPGDKEYETRLMLFKQMEPKDCTGQ